MNHQLLHSFLLPEYATSLVLLLVCGIAIRSNINGLSCMPCMCKPSHATKYLRAREWIDGCQQWPWFSWLISIIERSGGCWFWSCWLLFSHALLIPNHVYFSKLVFHLNFHGIHDLHMLKQSQNLVTKLL